MKTDENIKDMLDDSNIEYIHTQKNLDFIILDIFCQKESADKNVIVSKFLNDDIYGDVILCLETITHDDSRKIKLDTELFFKLANGLPARKNKYFFNIYHEFSD